MANKTYDLLGKIVESQAVTTTASCTGVNIVGLNIGSASYEVVFNYSATTGTVDGSNYYSLQLEVSDTVGGTYYPVGNAIKLPSGAGSATIGFNSDQIERLIAGADCFRVTATKTGTTATGVTYTAFISKI